MSSHSTLYTLQEQPGETEGHDDTVSKEDFALDNTTPLRGRGGTTPLRGRGGERGRGGGVSNAGKGMSERGEVVVGAGEAKSLNVAGGQEGRGKGISAHGGVGQDGVRGGTRVDASVGKGGEDVEWAGAEVVWRIDTACVYGGVNCTNGMLKGIHTHTHTHTCVCHTHTHSRTLTNTYTNTHTCTCTHTHTCHTHTQVS